MGTIECEVGRTSLTHDMQGGTATCQGGRFNSLLHMLNMALYSLNKALYSCAMALYSLSMALQSLTMGLYSRAMALYSLTIALDLLSSHGQWMDNITMTRSGWAPSWPASNGVVVFDLYFLILSSNPLKVSKKKIVLVCKDCVVWEWWKHN